MLATIDLYRSKLLKVTLKSELLRKFFFHRSARVFTLFLAACVLYLFASIFFPLWVLLIGPVIWGVPHIISSLRYATPSGSSESKESIRKFHLMAWLTVFLYRYAVDILHIDLFWSQHSLLLESVCIVVSFLVQSYILKRWTLLGLVHFSLFSCVIAVTYFFPIETALTLLIGHNYLPLLNWYRSCRHKADLNVFWLSTALFMAASAAIYFGSFSFLFPTLAPSGSIAFLNWDYSEIISPFVSENYDYQFWFRIVSLYAFSQAIHYFIWLKAVPENYQQHEHPPSFRTTFKLLGSEFGNGSVIMLTALVMVGLSGWLLYEFHVARLVYFAIASYHGFMEISALPFIFSNTNSSKRL